MESRGSANITLLGLKVLQPSPAESYLLAAQGFSRGVELLAKGDARLLFACAFLGGQTLECVLKSYLAHAGVPVPQLARKPLGHDLEALWLDASARGLNISVQPPQWCVTLNSLHDDPYRLRYPMGLHGFVFPEMLAMTAGLDSLVCLVEGLVTRR
jgi:hypothetical protein